MISFIWPWLLLLLPLPLLVMRWLPAMKPQYPAALKIPFYQDVTRMAAQQPGPRRWNRRVWLPAAIWVLLVNAVAQPVWIDNDQPMPTTGRDLMLLIDVSGSMRQMDFVRQGEPADRLSVVKEIASRFIDGRNGDRVGLMLFGDRPYLRASLSHDRQAVRQLIEEAAIALAGESTAIGDAVGLAIRRMRELSSDSRVIVLLTDGANNEGRINPRKAASLAARHGIKVYTIGVGAPETAAPNPYGIWSAENAGRFEREVLEQMAQHTGGHFFHVLDREGLQAAYDRLDELEPALGPNIDKYLATQLYPWPLALALLLSILMVSRQGRWAETQIPDAGRPS